MRSLAAALLLLLPAVPAAAQTPAPPDQAKGPMTLYGAADIVWRPGPATMPKGVELAVLEGDPTQPGFFTIRLRFPAGLRIMPHLHSQIEHATVLAGVLHLGMGRSFDSSATRPLPAGSFGFWVPGTPHFAWMEGRVVLQLHGQGPWTVTYVNPADDPRTPRP